MQNCAVTWSSFQKIQKINDRLRRWVEGHPSDSLYKESFKPSKIEKTLGLFRLLHLNLL
jgi:hypothetical protein